MPVLRNRLVVVAFAATGLALVSGCNSTNGGSSTNGAASGTSDNGGAMADGAAMVSSNGSMGADENSMSAGGENGGSMQSTDSMQKNSH
ncbi:MAG: hypothetical protein BVN33_17060 [Proteobacteria bacterium ST_bin13]|nr:MAG: hypothetical protein BVN33_17060 [Proteobacteria bacterium ST_bin13]